MMIEDMKACQPGKQKLENEAERPWLLACLLWSQEPKHTLWICLVGNTSVLPAECLFVVGNAGRHGCLATLAVLGSACQLLTMALELNSPVLNQRCPDMALLT